MHLYQDVHLIDDCNAQVYQDVTMTYIGLHERHTPTGNEDAHLH